MLPNAFCERMKELLGEEYDAFYRAMSEAAPVGAFRVNTVKLSVEDFEALPVPRGERVPYTDDGFYHIEEKIGHHPAHHAGMIYAQDPGAMSALSALDIPRGARVLDLCAAPGGKSAQIAAAIGEDGLLVSNEYVPSRCKILVSNVERLGIPNALVLNRDADTLSAMFPDFFDLVVVDAPCSGEGMFRKSEEARTEWSEENVRLCTERQRGILAAAAKTLRAGGTLVYSTCTFSVEENEGQVASFLASHPDFTLLPVKAALSEHTAPGIRLAECDFDLSKTRRFYPHIAKGEGQFVAVMQKTTGDASDVPAYRDAATLPTKAEHVMLADFFAAAMGDVSLADKVRAHNGKLILPPPIPLPAQGVFAAGVLVGECKGKVFSPHHQLFTTHGCRFTRKIELREGDPRLSLYLHGDVIPTDSIPNGFAAVLYHGVPLGGAKVVDGVAKNLYPKGLRRNF